MKLKNKTFGYCDRCKKSIPRKRIEVIPYSRYCLICQSMFESNR
ncbi:TraR/DksA family transcriptional regulator [Elusimicrobiota bacterium]